MDGTGGQGELLEALNTSRIEQRDDGTFAVVDSDGETVGVSRLVGVARRQQLRWAQDQTAVPYLVEVRRRMWSSRARRWGDSALLAEMERAWRGEGSGVDVRFDRIDGRRLDVEVRVDQAVVIFLALRSRAVTEHQIARLGVRHGRLQAERRALVLEAIDRFDAVVAATEMSPDEERMTVDVQGVRGAVDRLRWIDGAQVVRRPHEPATIASLLELVSPVVRTFMQRANAVDRIAYRCTRELIGAASGGADQSTLAEIARGHAATAVANCPSQLLV